MEMNHRLIISVAIFRCDCFLLPKILLIKTSPILSRTLLEYVYDELLNEQIST